MKHGRDLVVTYVSMLLGLGLWWALAGGCSASGEPCIRNSDCPSGYVCSVGECVYDGTGLEDGTDTGDGTDATDTGDGTDATDTGDGTDATDTGDGTDATDTGDGTDATAGLLRFPWIWSSTSYRPYSEGGVS